jgi:hypothetical protein
VTTKVIRMVLILDMMMIVEVDLVVDGKNKKDKMT